MRSDKGCGTTPSQKALQRLLKVFRPSQFLLAAALLLGSCADGNEKNRSYWF
jgi:hypothetical protein